MARILERLENGAFCPLGDGATPPVVSAIQYFRDEFMQHQKDGGCPFDPAASALWAGSAS